MKKIIYIVTASVLILTSAISAFAEERFQDNWKEKIMSEKIAFLTMEMGITPEEAQVFWPVYNQVEKEKDEAMFTMIHAYKEMSKAMEEKKGEKEISALLDKYLDAQKKVNEVENGIATKYKAVLPVEKVAKLYVAEEKFRRQHIRRLHGNHANK